MIKCRHSWQTIIFYTAISQVSGFRKLNSTDTCLSYLNNQILEGTDCGLMTGLILIDLKKAFDTIDHELLIEKMVHLQFSTQSILWFKSYLNNRNGIFSRSNSWSIVSKAFCRSINIRPVINPQSMPFKIFLFCMRGKCQ